MGGPFELLHRLVVCALKQALGGAVILHRSEASLVPCGTDLPFDTDFEVEPGLRVIHTPGHTPGSSCLLLHRGDLKVLFTGDHILRRRDEVPAPLHFPWTFDWDAQVASARRLLDLDFDYLVPSHGARLARGYFDDAHARLESALADCPCGLLLVSHDERFLQRLETRRWHVEGDGVGASTLTQ